MIAVALSLACRPSPALAAPADPAAPAAGHLVLWSGARWLDGRPPALARPPMRARDVASCGDLDGDGQRDLLVLGDDHLVVVPATTLRAGGAWDALPSVPATGSEWVGCADDLDGDGALEVHRRHGTTVDTLSGRALAAGVVAVLRTDRVPTPAPEPLDAFGLPLPDADPIAARAPVLPGWGSVVWSEPVDLDGDGRAEHLFVRRRPEALVIFPGTEACCTRPALVVDGFLTGAPITLDLDGDGRPELVASEPRTPAVWVWPGALDGATLRRRDARATLRTGLPTKVFGLDDLDGDGLPDLALFAPDLAALSLPRCTSPER